MADHATLSIESSLPPPSIAGLDPTIHPLLREKKDARVEPGNDER
jgi:hypothetical protein